MTKRKKLIIISSITLTILISMGLLLFIINNNRKSNNDALSQNPTSFSQPQENISYPIQIKPIGKFEFKNTNQFEVSKVTDISQNTFCIASYPVATIPADIDMYVYRFNKGQDSIFSKVINDIDKYKNNTDIDKVLNLYSRLLKGEINIDNSPKSYDFLGTVPRWCTGETIDPIYISTTSYPGTNESYLMIFGGSSQYAANHDSYPLELVIISRIDNSYSYLEQGIYYPEITESNNLQECESNSEYDYKYIKIHDKESQKCVAEKFKIDLDPAKLQEKLDFMMNIFELK